MRSVRGLTGTAVLLGVLSGPPLRAQAGQPDTPAFRVTTRLVFLDITVLDRKGRPVVKGLTKDDFTITESKKPRPIVSFDAPEAHLESADENPTGQAPVTVFVLDLLNSRFEDFAYIRDQVRRYLTTQPARLRSRAELLVLGNRSLEIIRGYTKSKEDLLYALDHLPPAVPYKLNGPFAGERFAQSIDALQQIALQNKGVPGRKNIVWVGHGAPSWITEGLPSSLVDELNRYVHDTTNMLVDSRMTLFVIYPGLRVRGPGFSISTASAGATIGDDDDPFAGDINFGVFVNETGGNLFYNRNDVAAEIGRSQTLGSEYYTLTYEPPPGAADGKFRRVRVTVRDPSLRVLTKAGYFAAEPAAAVHPRKQRLLNIAEAVRGTLPLPAVPLRIEDLVRHPDSGRVEFTVVMNAGNIGWQAADNGKSTANLMLAAASFNRARELLASRVETVTIAAPTQDASQLAKVVTKLPMRLRVPAGTAAVRAVVQTAETGRLGSVEIDSRMLKTAPEAPTPDPKLISRGPKGSMPATTPTTNRD